MKFRESQTIRVIGNFAFEGYCIDFVKDLPQIVGYIDQLIGVIIGQNNNVSLGMLS
jgi:hypothetical protein